MNQNTDKKSQRLTEGKVVSTKMAGVAVVEVTRYIKHPKYPKTIMKNKKFHVLNPGEVKVGQLVKFIETRPTSKTVRWVIAGNTEKEVETPKKPEIKSRSKKTTAKK